MKILFQLLNIFVFVVLISCQRFPPNLKDIIDTYGVSVTENDCRNLTDSRNPFTPCDKITGNNVNSNLIEALIQFLKDTFSSKDTNKLFTNLNLICKMGSLYDSCMKETDKLCKKYGSGDQYIRRQMRGNPLFSALKDLCDPKGEIKNKYTNTNNNVNLATCLGDSEKLLNLERAFDLVVSSIMRVKDILDNKMPPEISGRSKPTENTPNQQDPPARTAADDEKMNRLCDVYKEFLYKVNNAIYSCHHKTKELFLKLLELVIPVELLEKCALPSQDPSSITKSFNAANRERKTVFLFGIIHKLANNQTDLETCLFSANETITLLEFPQFKLECNVSMTSTYSYLKECELKMYDDQRDEIDALEMKGGVPENFKLSGGKTVSNGNSKGKGKPKKEITYTKESDSKFQFIDPNLGIGIRTFVYTTSSGLKVYNVAIRMPKIAFEGAGGIFSRSCLDRVNLATVIAGKRRRKRQTADSYSQAGQSDVKGFNDPNAGSMATTMQTELQALSNLDSTIISTSGTYSNIVVNTVLIISGVVLASLY